MDNFVASSKECECCQGYINTCTCCHDPNNMNCVKCAGKSPGDAGLDDAAGDAGGSAAHGGLVAADSEDPEYNWSVKVFPPQPDELPLELFEELFVPLIIPDLGKDAAGQSVAWPHRGWSDQTAFDREMKSAVASVSTGASTTTISSSSSNSSSTGCAANIYTRGLVIARNQRETEAKELVARLISSQLPVVAVKGGNPPMFSANNVAPTRGGRRRGGGGGRTAETASADKGAGTVGVLSEDKKTSSSAAAAAAATSDNGINEDDNELEKVPALPKDVSKLSRVVHIVLKIDQKEADNTSSDCGRYDKYIDTWGQSIISTLKQLLGGANNAINASGGTSSGYDRDLAATASVNDNDDVDTATAAREDNTLTLEQLLALEDGKRSYKWSDRGWPNENYFKLHVLASLRSYGECVVARYQTYIEGFLLIKQLKAEGFANVYAVAVQLPASLRVDDSFVYSSSSSSSAGEANSTSVPGLARNTMESDLRCPNGHCLDICNSKALSRSINCDSCGRNSMHAVDNFTLSCRGCDFDLCEICCCTGHTTKDSALDEDDNVMSENSLGEEEDEDDDDGDNVQNTSSSIDAAIRAHKSKAAKSKQNPDSGNTASFVRVPLPILYVSPSSSTAAAATTEDDTDDEESGVNKTEKKTEKKNEVAVAVPTTAPYPIQSAGLANSTSARMPAHIQGLPDLSGLPAHVSSNLQAALAHAHAVGDVESIGQLFNLLIQASNSGNSKPATDDSAVAALPRIIFDKEKSQAVIPKNEPPPDISNEEAAATSLEENHNAKTEEKTEKQKTKCSHFDQDMSDLSLCAICREDFETGDVVTKLPCGHAFHMGLTEEEQEALEKQKKTAKKAANKEEDDEDEEEDLCPGIATWLKKSNECPMCRAPLPKKGEKNGEDNSTHWNCPGCRRDLENETRKCDLCGIQRNVHAATRSQGRPVFEATEELFAQCIEYAALGSASTGITNASKANANTGTGAGAGAGPVRTEVDRTLAAEDKRRKKLQRKILQLLHSRDMDRLVAANWQLREGVEHLLNAALTSQLHLPFTSSSWLDNNSLGMYTLLVDRLQARLNASANTTTSTSNDDPSTSTAAAAAPVVIIHRPSFSPVSNSAVSLANNNCSLCDTPFPADNQTPQSVCDCCGARFKIVLLSQMPQLTSFFNEGLNLVFRHLQLSVDIDGRQEEEEGGQTNVTSASSASAATSATAGGGVVDGAAAIIRNRTDVLMKALIKDCTRFLNGRQMKTLERDGWMVQAPFAALFQLLARHFTAVRKSIAAAAAATATDREEEETGVGAGTSTTTVAAAAAVVVVVQPAIIPFETGAADLNSRALYGFFIRRLLAQLQAHGALGPSLSLAAAAAAAIGGGDEGGAGAGARYGKEGGGEGEGDIVITRKIGNGTADVDEDEEEADKEAATNTAVTTKPTASASTSTSAVQQSSSSSSPSSLTSTTATATNEKGRKKSERKLFGHYITFAEPTVLARELGDIEGMPLDETPTSSSSSNDDYAVDFSEQRFCPLRSGDNAVALLRANKKVFLRIARSIALGAGEFEWSMYDNKFLPHMQKCGWMIHKPIKLMRSGLRDLQTLTRGLDRGTCVVVEAILLKVLLVEREQREAMRQDGTGTGSGALSASAPVPLLRRQLSVGAAAKHGLSLMQHKVPPAVYSRVLKFLIKTMSYIRADPSNLMYRRLKKNSQLMTLHILPSFEAMSVLRSVGFTDGDTGNSGEDGATAADEVLVMNVVDMDKVARLLQVLKEEAADVGLDM